MDKDVLWKLDLLDALSFESLFNSAQTTQSNPGNVRFVRPTEAESARAVDNIRAWRSYLPEVCVSIMIADGWQWST